MSTSSDVTSLCPILVVELLDLNRLEIVLWMNDGPSYSANVAPNHKCFSGRDADMILDIRLVFQSQVTIGLLLAHSLRSQLRHVACLRLLWTQSYEDLAVGTWNT